MSKNSSFKTRLTILNSITIVFVMISTIAVLFYAFDRVVRKEMEDSLLNEARLIARIIDEDNEEYEIAQKSGYPMEEVDLEEDIRGFSKKVIIKNEQSNKLYYSEDLPENKLSFVYKPYEHLSPGGISYSDENLGEDLSYRFVHYRYQDKENRVYRISVGNSLRKVHWATQRFMLTLVVGLPLICVLSSLAVYFIAKQGLRPLDKIISQAENIKKDRFSSIPLEKYSPKEIYRLNRALNRMLLRLEDAFEREKQFSAAASHELRTPLTALKGSIEVALTKQRSSQEYEETLSENLEEVNRLISIIDNLLLLARLDEGEFNTGSAEDIDVENLLKDTEEYARTLCATKEIDIKTNIEHKKNLHIRGRRRLLNQALYNLVSNACKHSGAGQLYLGAVANSDKVILSIRDDGKGIAKEDRPYLFSRFYRGEQARQSFGYGLGLAIVKAIVRAHSGEIKVESEPGKGTLFTLTFPTS